MKSAIALLVASVLVVYIEATTVPRLTRRLPCNNLSDCPCGSQCISDFFIAPCEVVWPGRCSCREGCTVGNLFIPADTTNPNAYCNECTCPDIPALSQGIPSCTRRPWCDLPWGRPLYPENPNCD